MMRYRVFVAWVVLVGLALPVLAAADGGFLDALHRAEVEGRITREDALLNTFRYAFDPASVRSDLMVADGAPLKCLTPAIAEYESLRGGLAPATRSEIDSYLRGIRPLGKITTQTYLSPAGLFTMNYETSGSNAPPQADVDPVNGVPDYVELCAVYCDSSWHREIDDLGFNAPGGGTYQIYFQNMGAYGYTQGTGGGSSYIVLENDFAGFPSNQDPDGNVLGAAKVTAAHEFKHASQFNTTGAMATGGWVELDATWMEDVVFDETNDYYGYLISGSSISNPDQSLDNGGSGSYEDCIWQHFLCEKWGIGMGLAFMQRREAAPTETATASYAAIIADQGSDFHTAFTEFASWNYVTGILGQTAPPYIPSYEEAGSYPTAGTWAYRDAYPDTSAGGVTRMAAHFYQCKGMTALSGRLRIQFDGEDGTSIRVTALLRRKGVYGGGWFREDIPLDAQNDGDYTLSLPGEELKQVAVLVVNAKRIGGEATYSMVLSLGEEATDVTNAVPLALPFGLEQNRPNPFNPATSIAFTLPADGAPSLVVYNPAGRVVRTLLGGETMSAGAHTVQWDGRDDRGRSVGSGVYHYRLVADNLSETKRMILIR
ncbi:MAG: MXAN_6640 family putative metalloprotease [Candidatus Eisenbacteria bacterium]